MYYVAENSRSDIIIIIHPIYHHPGPALSHSPARCCPAISTGPINHHQPLLMYPCKSRPTPFILFFLFESYYIYEA